MSSARHMSDLDPATLEFKTAAANMRERLAKMTNHPQVEVEQPQLPKIKNHRFNLFTSTVALLFAALVSFVWISVGAISGDDVSRTTIVVVLDILFFAIVGFCAVIARDYRDRVQLAAIETMKGVICTAAEALQAEIHSATAEMQRSMHVGMTDVRTQLALFRAEISASVDNLPGRFELYAEQRITDYEADERICPDTGRVTADGASAPTQLSVVRDLPRPPV
jgi:hypothetical protein